MRTLALSAIEIGSDTEEKMILISCIVSCKLIRKNRNKDGNQDNLSETNKRYPNCHFGKLRGIRHQSGSENSEFMHRIKSNITAAKKYSHKEPTQFAGGVRISTETPKRDKKPAIQNCNDDEKFKKVFNLNR